MPSPLALALLSAAALTFALFLLRRVPAVWSCPTCHHATSPVQDRWTRPLAPWFERRWCARCQWSGLSRRREWIAPEPPSEPSGRHFRWARPTAGPWTGFHWAEADEEPGNGPSGGTGDLDEAARLSNFAWRSGKRETGAFVWAEDPAARPGAAPQEHSGPGFSWRSPKRQGSRPGFRWGA